MGTIANLMRELCSPVRQAWKDYKLGRMMRKNQTKEVEQLECNETENEKEDETSTGKIVRAKTATNETETPPQPTKSSLQKGWQFTRMADFPWSIEEIVQEESNWRGTWILEVKDMQAMDWQTVRVPKESGRGGKYQRRPTKHLPFTPDERQQGDSIVLSDGGQDDLMVWLGKR
ncbi:hypothetical protein QBC41DRAFT_349920 [Cercophora samala]|uniref:Uncharacterized protein n=1 Tax=Cercophora samala TaxID=330535 RepID=A0AA40D651_9PEZI|nr:hypothetical protein QBC41DRAFT_349920 [Cercophora samala]